MMVENQASFLIASGATPATGIVFWSPQTGIASAALLARLDGVLARDATFAAAAVLRTQDGGRVALYGQWATEAACRIALAGLADAVDIQPSDADAFELTTRLPSGRDVPIRRGDIAAFGEFWTTPEHQDDLIAREPAAAATALADGGILSANFHRGLDGTRMVNYAQLADRDAVARLAAKPGFNPDSGYWRAFARNEFHVYDVVSVVVAGA